MSQTSEPGIKSEHSEGQADRRGRATDDQCRTALAWDRRARKQVGYGTAIQRVVG